MNTIQIIEFLAQKRNESKSALSEREQMIKTLESGTSEDWSAAAAMHPSTIGRKFYKADRLKEADLQKRIAVKIRHEIEMFNAAIETLSKS